MYVWRSLQTSRNVGIQNPCCSSTSVKATVDLYSCHTSFILILDYSSYMQVAKARGGRVIMVVWKPFLSASVALFALTLLSYSRICCTQSSSVTVTVTMSVTMSPVVVSQPSTPTVTITSTVTRTNTRTFTRTSSRTSSISLTPSITPTPAPQYYLGPLGASCTQTCAALGLTCTTVFTGNTITPFTQLGVSCVADGNISWAPYQPAYIGLPSSTNYTKCQGW